MLKHKKHLSKHTQKKNTKRKIWTIPLLLESSKSKQLQKPDLEKDFLIDSGAEPNIINIPTWKEIKILHPQLTPFKTKK